MANQAAEQKLEYHTLIKEVQLSLLKEAEHWKDQMVGYHQWQIKYICHDGKVFHDTMSGTEDEVKRVAALYGPDDEAFGKLCEENDLE